MVRIRRRQERRPEKEEEKDEQEKRASERVGGGGAEEEGELRRGRRITYSPKSSQEPLARTGKDVYTSAWVLLPRYPMHNRWYGIRP